MRLAWIRLDQTRVDQIDKIDRQIDRLDQIRLDQMR